MNNNPRRDVLPPNHRSYHDRKPPYHHRDRPPGPPPVHHRPHFTVELRCTTRTFPKSDLDDIVSRYKSKIETYDIHTTGPLALSLYFRQWIDALEATVSLWEENLDGDHSLTPYLLPSKCDMERLRDRLTTLFIEHVKQLIEGDLVQTWQKKLGLVVDEIGKVKTRLRHRNNIGVYEELTRKKVGLESEKRVIEKRIGEFKSAMECVLSFLERRLSVEDFKVIRLSKHFDWVRIHCLIKRECRRLKDGLPIYAFREDILRDIYNQQVMVLIGETGSGKSTQLVQFLADSGVAGNGSIICTQPRKIAAISLAQRVQEECCGCYQNNATVSFATYTSAQQFNSKA
jgi:ATP-dependent RNA helicase DHX8/PRP22